MPNLVKNWAGDEVLVVQQRGQSHGKQVDHVWLSTTSEGSLIGGESGMRALELDCSAPTDTSADAWLEYYQAQMATTLLQVRGYLEQALDFDVRAVPQAPEHAWGSCSQLAGEDEESSLVCGCRVSECPQGSFAADAMAWGGDADIGFVNGGSLRSSLPAGAVSEASVLQMLPFLNDVVRLEVSGAALKQALLNSVSRLGDASAASNPNGRMGHVSSSLHYEW